MGDYCAAVLTSGDIELTGTTDAGGEVNILSAGDIDGAGLVTAPTVDLDAATGIGGSTQLELAASAISIDSTGIGNVDADNAAPGAVTVATLTAGTGTITFEQTGNESLTVTTASTTDGAIDITNEGDEEADFLRVDSATAGGDTGSNDDITLTTTSDGDVLIGALTALTDEVTISSAAAINEIGDGDAGVDISTSTATLDADDEIGSTTGESDIETTVAFLDASSSTAGAIVITETDGIELTDVDTNDGAITIAAGCLLTATDVDANGGTDDSVTLTTSTGGMVLTLVDAADDASATATTGDITIGSVTAADVISIEATAGSINEIGAGDGGVDIASATATLMAANQVGSTAGDLDIETDVATLNVTASAGGIVIDESDAVVIGTLSSGGAATITAGGNITDTSGATMAVTGLATFDAGSDDITIGDDDTINFGSLNLTGGAVTVTEDSSTLLTGVIADTLTLTSAAEIEDATTITVTGLAIFDAGAFDITLGDGDGADTTNFGSLDVTGAIVSITEDSATTIAGVAAGTSFLLTSFGAVTQTGAIVTTTLAVKTRDDAGADITLENVGNNVTALALVSLNATDMLASTGAISYVDSDDFAVTLVSTINGGTMAVKLESLAGAIKSAVGGFSNTEINAPDGTITLRAVTGIDGGEFNFLTFVASNLDVVNTTSGTVNLLESTLIGGSADDGKLLTIDSLVNSGTDFLFLVSAGDMFIQSLSTGGSARIQGRATNQSITGDVDIFTSQSGISGPGDFGVLQVFGKVNLTGSIKNVVAPLATSTVVRVLGGTCVFNGIVCLNNPGAVIPGDALELFDPAQFLPSPPPTDTSTNSLSNTPAQAAFNDDPLEGEYAVDVFGTEFELVETAGGAEAAYTGLNYVFRDFWEFLEEGEGGEGEAEEGDAAPVETEAVE